VLKSITNIKRKSERKQELSITSVVPLFYGGYISRPNVAFVVLEGLIG
jgi:hypothetical protein